MANHAERNLLGQGRPIVRKVRLLPDQRQVASEAAITQRLGGMQSSQRGTNDHYSLGAAHLSSPATAAPALLASTVMARTGQADAARSTRSRCASSGSGTCSSTSLPRSVNTSGA